MLAMLNFCIVLALLYPITCNTHHQIYYKKDVSTEIGVDSEEIGVSDADCAAICLKSESCKSIQFNKKSNKCRMSTVSLAAPDNRGVVYSAPVGTPATQCVSGGESCEDDGAFYHSCGSCNEFAQCVHGTTVIKQCDVPLEWDQNVKACAWNSSTCNQ